MQLEKKSALSKYNKEKHLEKMDYFPFLHGDEIERHRRVIEAL